MENFGIIYKATNKVNGKVYIGQTTKSLEKRKSKHLSDTRCGRYGGSIFLKAMNRYKESNFMWIEICKCYSRKELDDMENYYIDLYKSNNTKFGYNLITGRGRSGYKLSEEAKHKISEKAIIRLSIPENNPMYGKSISDICGDKISRKLKKYYINNLGSFTNRKHSAESKLKMSESRTGKGNHFYGKNLTKDHRAKISEALRGREFSNAHKRKISESRIGKYLGSENKTSKKYIITGPNGNNILIHGLSNFCRENNLNQSHMSSCATGKRKSHKGFKCKIFLGE